MRRWNISLLVALALGVLMTTLPARANLSDYTFQYTYGQWMSSKSQTTLLKAGANDDVSAITGIGFTFYFDGKPYTEFTVSANGLIGLGNQPVSGCWLNALTTPNGICDGQPGFDYTLATTPHIAPFWDDLRIPDAAEDGFDSQITYYVTGNAPNRVLVISFPDIETDYYDYNYSTFQVRMYETSNRIEFYYDFLNPNYYDGNGASIGLAVDQSNFLSVFPDYGTATTSTSEVDDYYYPSEPSMDQGAMYVFQPCTMSFTGDVAEGGTPDMTDGDVLLSDKHTMIYSNVAYLPFSVSIASPCSGRSVDAEVSGPAGGDYLISPSSFKVSTDEQTTIEVDFRPTGVGVRPAVLTLTDDQGKTYTYGLAAIGDPRIVWTGNASDGGSVSMASGDVLMTSVTVKRGLSGDFQPFMLTNIQEDQETPPANVSYWIKGISGGQYSITPPTDVVGSGQSVTPTITFAPTSIGPIVDSLFVTADGETRAFQLKAFASGVGASFTVNTQVLSDSAILFANKFSCSGVGPITLPLVVRNIGSLPFEITGADFYQTDTVYTQGQPRYPLVMQNGESPISSADYVLTEQPPVIPITGAQAHFPMTVGVGTSRTLYLTFISQTAGKRFARAFIYTNAENISSHDASGEIVEGLLSLDMYGRGVGGSLSDNPAGGLPKSILMPDVSVGQSTDATMTLFNVGNCELHIAMRSFRFHADDADEFAVTSIPSPTTNTIDPKTDELVLQPGDHAAVSVRFTPSQIGSRRATMRLETNDSTIQIPGLTERGSYYIDFYGGVKSGLVTGNVDVGTVTVGTSTAGKADGVIRVSNPSQTPITITTIEVAGANAGDFEQIPTAWATPVVVPSGGTSNFGIELAPAAGSFAGPRNAIVRFITSTNDTVIAGVHGTVGTRSIAVLPGTIGFGVGVGRQQRKTVAIANTGTLPLDLTAPVLGGTNPTDYSLGALPRTTLAPGQTEYLEVTYTPMASGSSSATLTIGSNATDGAVVVTLNGTSRTIKPGDDPSVTIAVAGSNGQLQQSAADLLSGVAGTTEIAGVTLSQSVPNPGRDRVEIGYSLARRAAITLALYDGTGRLLNTLDAGVRDAGERTMSVDVSTLPSGVYHYRLTVDGQTMSRSMTVVR